MARPKRRKSAARRSHGRRQPPDWIVRLASLGFCFIGIGILLFVAFPLAARCVQAQSWRRVDATVVSSGVVEATSGRGTGYEPLIIYEYGQDGRTYRSAGLYLTSSASRDRASHEKIVLRYRPGDHVVAWVNPGDFHDAVLYRGFTVNMLAPLVVGMGFAIIGGICFFTYR